MRKKECIAMLLAGGQGSRLGALTRKNAKPAVAFGGKYRVIDFGLSNCVNSGIDTVGVLTQYKPLSLHDYLGTGASWDLDDPEGGIHTLPPYATETGGRWYNGTADAIYRNINFVDRYDPEYVLILSGDHLYQMDYTRMLDFHKKNGAALTVAVIEVPLAEASRFGILTADETMRITRFEEKPKHPDSTLASMGVYIFSWEILRRALIADHEDRDSERDFGKNIIPRLLRAGERLFAYTFRGYWRDVGTIESYYDAQMDLLEEQPEFRIFDRTLRTFSNANMSSPHYVGPEAEVSRCLVSNGCEVCGHAEHSILSTDAVVEQGASVTDSILLPGAVVRSGGTVRRAILGEGAVVENGAVLDGGTGIALIGDTEVYTGKGGEKE